MVSLPPLQESLWQSYLEVDGRREARIEALNQFIPAALELENDVVWEWARDLARRVVDESQRLPIRQPLFDAIIYPALWAGCKGKTPGCCRWLAGLSTHLYRYYRRKGSSYWEAKAIRLVSESDLLARAVSIDPEDARSRERLIQVMASQFDDALHELPAGVVQGSQGATIAQCEALSHDLGVFRGHVEHLGYGQRYAKLIEACGLHFPAYAAYLAEAEQWPSYEHYLQAPDDR